MLVRTLTESDMPHLQKLYRYLDADNTEIPLNEALQRWEMLKGYPHSDIFVACKDEVPVASCSLIVIPNLTRIGAPYALIENVVTHPDHRKQGLGTAVLHAAVERAWQAGCYKVMLMTGSKQASTLNSIRMQASSKARPDFRSEGRKQLKIYSNKKARAGDSAGFLNSRAKI